MGTPFWYHFETGRPADLESQIHILKELKELVCTFTRGARQFYSYNITVYRRKTLQPVRTITNGSIYKFYMNNHLTLKGLKSSETRLAAMMMSSGLCSQLGFELREPEPAPLLWSKGVLIRQPGVRHNCRVE